VPALDAAKCSNSLANSKNSREFHGGVSPVREEKEVDSHNGEMDAFVSDALLNYRNMTETFGKGKLSQGGHV
jgi:hypothetical protein